MSALDPTTFPRVADFTLGLRCEDIPRRVLDYARLLALDLLGVAAGAGCTDAGRIARALAAEQFASGPGAGTAGLLFDGRRASPAGAAYANATLIDSLDGHDGYAPAKGHIGAAILPGLLAFAESGAPVGGDEALACMVIGYELASRAGVALHASVADYHTSGAWNALAVAAIGARLRGLGREPMRQALGIAEYHGPRSQMMREVDHPSMLHDGSGWGALAGVAAVALAGSGFTGAPAITVEDAGVAAHWHDLGERWLTLEQYVKPYPVCRWAHAPIDAALALREAHGFTPDEVAAIEIATFHESARLGAGMPGTTGRAQYSLAFPVAAALARGRVGVDEVAGSGLHDPEIERLVGRITVSERERYNACFPAERRGDVTVVLADGRRLESGEHDARGGAGALLPGAEIRAKFHAFAAPVLGAERAGHIESAVLSLGEQGTSLGALLPALNAAPAGPDARPTPPRHAAL